MPEPGDQRSPGADDGSLARRFRQHAAALTENGGSCLHRTVQTNEPGRSAVLMAVLLWLTDRDRRPMRLLEVGAGAGLDLLADRYRYVIGGAVIGDPDSPVAFDEPWRVGPALDPVAKARALEVSHRAGCDPSPLNRAGAGDRRRLLSYIWPDELPRFRRLQAALTVAAVTPPRVDRATAADWLAGALQERTAGEVTVVWHSVVPQYVPAPEWDAVPACVADAQRGDPRRPVVQVGLEPGRDHQTGFAVTARAEPDRPEITLARCGDHGPPVTWATERP
jgi:hypothetical protein